MSCFMSCPFILKIFGIMRKENSFTVSCFSFVIKNKVTKSIKLVKDTLTMYYQLNPSHLLASILLYSWENISTIIFKKDCMSVYAALLICNILSKTPQIHIFV